MVVHLWCYVCSFPCFRSNLYAFPDPERRNDVLDCFMSCTAVATNTVWKAGRAPQCKCGLRSASICWWPQYFPNPRSALGSRLRVLGGRSHLDRLGNHDRCFNHICKEPYVIDEVGMNCVCEYTFSLSAGFFMVLCIHFATCTFCMAASMFAKK